ncbi:hypothetical protein B0A55_04363 [Friedmanniomyces simplex]|uniref:Uncharacterized protein n=1 Tax=Friedmanniomyces simplex TaxID=329884 RepID=A0A4U0XQH2_9PEZI|nr:hypothetical protein B0A55_04363 [Friedmanniomyces simplex]
MASSTSSYNRHHYGQADIQAAEALLALHQPIYPKQQPLANTAPTSSSHTQQQQDHSDSHAAETFLPLSPLASHLEHDQPLTNLTHSPSSPPPRQYNQADLHAAGALLALNPQLPRLETISDRALVCMYWYQLDDATVNCLFAQYGAAGIVEMVAREREATRGASWCSLKVEDVRERARVAFR